MLGEERGLWKAFDLPGCPLNMPGTLEGVPGTLAVTPRSGTHCKISRLEDPPRGLWQGYFK
jgi:hypothetical protein